MNGSSLSVIAILGFACLLIERIFYYKSKYGERKKEKVVPANPGNPGHPDHGERIASLETEAELTQQNNEKDHKLIRDDIKKLFNLFNGMRK